MFFDYRVNRVINLFYRNRSGCIQLGYAGVINIINTLIKMSEVERNELRKKNLELYKAEFTNEAFAKRYIDSLHKILG